MELKSTYFTAHMSDACKDILAASMKEMIAELSVNAIFVMNTDIQASITARTTELICETLKNSKFRFMPFHLVCEGFHRGSMGELGGTTRFTVRNVNTWMNAMYEKLAQINIARATKEDAERRAAEARAFKHHQKASSIYATAMGRKIDWFQASGPESSAEYDRCSLDKIVEAIKKGYSVDELKPSMIL